MRIKKIHIQNFKSLVDFELDNPKPFCAFVGPNASGKSNIFEALEFVNYLFRYRNEAPIFFGGTNNIFSFNPIIIDYLNPDNQKAQLLFVEFSDNIKLDFIADYTNVSYDQNESSIRIHRAFDLKRNSNKENEPIRILNEPYQDLEEYRIFIQNFSHLFVGKSELLRINSESKKLKTDASNLSQIIGQIFQNEAKREDFIGWLQILIPEFENIEVKQSNIDGSFEFFVYEKNSPSKPFPRHLLSDGTKNILALMAAVYQSNEPQFLCIEEPENGLHPQAIKFLVDFFREKCETEGHHIWLNTHSPTLVRRLEINEIILVNKINGVTIAKQASVKNNIKIKTDEAWLTNALGGGVL